MIPLQLQREMLHCVCDDFIHCTHYRYMKYTVLYSKHELITRTTHKCSFDLSWLCADMVAVVVADGGVDTKGEYVLVVSQSLTGEEARLLERHDVNGISNSVDNDSNSSSQLGLLSSNKTVDVDPSEWISSRGLNGVLADTTLIFMPCCNSEAPTSTQSFHSFSYFW